MTDTANIGLTYVEASQNQKEVTINSAFAKLDALVGGGVIDKDLATPPASPSEGDVYIVATSATGDWATYDDKIAYYSSGWKFVTPREGLSVWVDDEDKYYNYTGSAWATSDVSSLSDLSDVDITSAVNYDILQHDGTDFVNSSQIDNLSQLGINTSSDSTNKLAVASSYCLFTNIGSDIRLVMNKSSSTDTASYVFQTNWSGRAEFGLAGDDNFTFKVSSDGSTWYQSFVLDSTNGEATFKNNAYVEGVMSLLETTTPLSSSGYGKLYSSSADSNLYYIDGSGNNFVVAGNATTKSYTLTTNGISAGTHYCAGFYKAPLADVTLSDSNTTHTYGTTNVSYGAHVFVVCGSVGTSNKTTGAVEIEVSGTSISDSGTLTASDTEVLIADIEDASVTTDAYFQTTKKWVGTVTYTIQNNGTGDATTFTIDVNYGFARSDSFNDTDFDLKTIEISGFCNTNDSSVNFELLHHTSSGWTYSATAFVPGTSAVVDFATIYGGNVKLGGGQQFGLKRTGLSTSVTGSSGDGYLIRATTTATNCIQYANFTVGANIK